MRCVRLIRFSFRFCKFVNFVYVDSIIIIFIIVYVI